MGGRLVFRHPFSGYNSLTFTNCWASVQMHLEGITGTDEYGCPRREGKPCTGCGHCSNSTSRKQEARYFLLDTVCGRSSVRPDFAGPPDDTDNSPDTVDFLMGFGGYGYRVVQENVAAEIRAAIDGGTPVLVRVKDASNGAFRVITGYEGDRLVMADPANAQGKPTPPTCEDIAEAIIVTGRVPPRYALLDALRRIQRVMVRNRENRVWDRCMESFDYWGDKLPEAGFEEIQRRFRRIHDMAWYNFNCHNFAETFRQRAWEPLRDPLLDEVCRQIDRCYDLAHTRNWQLIALYECRDWSRRRYNELEWGYCGCVVQCLERLKEYDAEVLAAVEKAIALVGEAQGPP